MAASTYTAFSGRMIQRYEGGYGWNRKDPGGPTKYGITCYDLAEHRHLKMTSMASWAPLVQAMTLSEAEDIYRTKYATAVHYDELPAGIDVVMMDYGVNSGTSRAILVAHRLLNVAGTTMDNALLDAIAHCDPAAFINKMCDERLTFMHGIRGGASWAEFGHGWQSRVDDLRAYALHLLQPETANAVAPIAPDLSLISTPKATHEPKTASGATAGTAVAAAGAAYASGMPWYVIVGAVLAIVIAGVAYEALQEAKAKNANATVTV